MEKKIRSMSYGRIIISILFAFSVHFLNANGHLTKIREFGENPGNLQLYLKESRGVKRPLVIVLHGCNQTAKSGVTTSGWDQLAEQHDLFILAPQQKTINNASRCFNWFIEKDNLKNSGEAGSIYEMIRYCVKNYSIDTNRILITGFSAGAQMSVTMLSLYPELFQSGAVFAGGAFGLVKNPGDALSAMLGKINPTDQELINNVRSQNKDYSKKYPNLFIHQGNRDHVVSPENAKILCRQWCGLNETDSSLIKKDVGYKTYEFITRSEYTTKDQKSFVVLYEYHGVGHQLPVNPGKGDNQGGRSGVFTIDLDYWSTLQVARDFGLLD